MIDDLHQGEIKQLTLVLDHSELHGAREPALGLESSSALCDPKEVTPGAPGPSPELCDGSPA